MNIKRKIEELLFYYESTRGVGHTTLLKEGTNNNIINKLILVYNKSTFNYLENKTTTLISWKNIKALRGNNKPLSIDNGVITLLLMEVLEEFNKLTNKNDKLKNELKKLKINTMNINIEKLDEATKKYANNPTVLNTINSCVDIVLSYSRVDKTSHNSINLSENFTVAVNTLKTLGIYVNEINSTPQHLNS